MSDEVRICASCWEEDCVCDYEQYITIDQNIADIIILLNTKGYRTNFCCEGHILPETDEQKEGIMDIYVACRCRFESLPEGFMYPKSKNRPDFHRTIQYRYRGGILKAKIDGKYIPYYLEKDKFEHLRKLKEWAERLPKIDIVQHPDAYSAYLATGTINPSAFEWELPRCATYKVQIDNDKYEKVASSIIYRSGKILEVKESDEKLEVYYLAQEDLFKEEIY